MAQPADQDLTITRGDTETLVVTITTDGSTAVDITGRTYSSQIRSQQDSTTIKASFTCTVTDGASGQVTCTLSATSSAALSAGLYFWDLQENASGVISTILSGNVTVLADVTR
jgi:hypothetical protein